MKCTKVSYKSKEQAVKALHKIKNAPDGIKPIRAYQCDICKLWHLTKKEIISDVAYDNQRLKFRDVWEMLVN